MAEPDVTDTKKTTTAASESLTVLADAERLFALVAQLFDEGRYAEAVPHAERVLELRSSYLGNDAPPVAEAHATLGALYLKLHDFDAARALYARAVEVFARLPKPLQKPHVTLLDEALCGLHSQSRGALRPHDELISLIYRVINAESDEDFARSEARAEDPERIKVSGDALASRAVKRVEPSYPKEARKQRGTGTVLVNVIISQRGEVSKARSVCGHMLLRTASEDASRRWRFTPTLLSGQPVEVSGIIIFNFALQ